jgi:hypothetical protein
VKSSSNKRRQLRWRLMRAGHAYSHGTTRGRRLRLDLGNLRRGRYVLHIQGRKAGIPIVVR